MALSDYEEALQSYIHDDDKLVRDKFSFNFMFNLNTQFSFEFVRIIHSF